jgi:hypothetical protein
MCDGFYNGLYKLENRDGQYYWHYMYSPNIYNTPYLRVNIESDRKQYFIEGVGCWTTSFLFKEEDLGNNT